MVSNDKKTYWPHMILGFLFLAILLSYWTVRTASSMPVQETDDYMMKYQMSDTYINEIIESKQAFDAKYDINIVDVKTMVMTDNIHSNRPQPDVVELVRGKNSFRYQVTLKDGTPVSDTNATFLLTRPHTNVDNVLIEKVDVVNGYYQTPEINVTRPGRYTLRFRSAVGNTIGHSKIEAYLKP